MSSDSVLYVVACWAALSAAERGHVWYLQRYFVFYAFLTFCGLKKVKSPYFFFSINKQDSHICFFLYMQMRLLVILPLGVILPCLAFSSCLVVYSASPDRLVTTQSSRLPMASLLSSMIVFMYAFGFLSVNVIVDWLSACMRFARVIAAL